MTMIIANWAGAVALGFLGLMGATIIALIWTGKINLSRVISEPNGDASMSRLQFLIFSFVIAAGLFMVVAASDRFPDIPQNVLVLLGISASSYLVSKGIQFSSDQGTPDVTVTPNSAHTKIGGASIQFSATVERAENQGVSWSIDTPDSGTISETGLYSPPKTLAPNGALPKTVTVRATSKADATSDDIGIVVIDGVQANG